MALLDTMFMNFGLLQTGTTIFWFAIVLGLIIWKNSKDWFVAVVITAAMIGLFLPSAKLMNVHIAPVIIILILIGVVNRFMK